MNDLAGMVKRGFDEVGNRITGVEERLRIMSENNAREHEAIMLRLDNVAYRFELVELQKRVETLEKKLGLKPKERV